MDFPLSFCPCPWGTFSSHFSLHQSHWRWKPASYKQKGACFQVPFCHINPFFPRENWNGISLRSQTQDSSLFGIMCRIKNVPFAPVDFKQNPLVFYECREQKTSFEIGTFRKFSFPFPFRNRLFSAPLSDRNVSFFARKPSIPFMRN